MSQSFVLLLVVCVIAFLVGGIPFGYLAGRWILHDDIRKHGSGNIGATNVGRVLGWKWGGIVLVLDALKGLLPTLAAEEAARHWATSAWQHHIPVAAGICAIAGHMYPVVLRLRGGKGVATALGVVLVLAPTEVLIALAVFVPTVLLTRKIALGSILAAVTYAAAWLYHNHDHAWTAGSSSLTAFSIFVPVLIVWRHRANLARLLAGTEPSVTTSADPRRLRESASSVTESRTDG